VRMTASLPLPLRKRLLTALPLTALLLTALLLTAFVLTACSPATPASQESTSAPPPVVDRGVASISFDDGTIGHYRYARRVLRKNNLPGTYYLISDALGWGTATINPKQARKLLAEGNEIGNHTRDHKDLTRLTTGQMTAEFADAQDAIESQVGVRPTTCAYPYGSNNAAVLAEAENQFKGCRSTQGGSTNPVVSSPTTCCRTTCTEAPQPLKSARQPSRLASATRGSCSSTTASTPS
jgi:peptidoglycan/xylan/chitin deacetylase (PgdA/CDA1 family)